MTGEGREDIVLAVVSKIVGDGSKRYAVAYPYNNKKLPTNTAITFSLSKWQGEDDPQKGQVVTLWKIMKYARGWRAMEAEPVEFDPRSQELRSEQ